MMYALSCGSKPYLLPHAMLEYVNTNKQTQREHTMSIIEINEKVYMNLTSNKLGKEALYFYTPLCGTCKIGERMLEIVNTMNNQIPIRKINMNYSPILRDLWQITSVPCLVVLQDGKPEQFIYAMRSVDYLYELLK
jgi:thiol-disulfide isomerase/thioredoxin